MNLAKSKVNLPLGLTFYIVNAWEGAISSTSAEVWLPAVKHRFLVRIKPAPSL